MIKFPKNNIISDPKYLRYQSTRPCYVCGIEDGTIVGHHLKNKVPRKRKSGDNHTLPLCFYCHTGPKGVELHGNETVWFLERGFKDPVGDAELFYQEYKNSH